MVERTQNVISVDALLHASLQRKGAQTLQEYEDALCQRKQQSLSLSQLVDVD